MKRNKLLGVSLLLNVVLFLLVMDQKRESRRFSSRLPLSPMVRALPPTIRASSTNGQVEVQAFWNKVESQDYQVYIQNLRAAGCPEATIKDIVTADVNALINSQFAERLTRLQKSAQYWRQSTALADLISMEQQAKSEKKAILTTLFGADIGDLGLNFPLSSQDLGLSYLPDEKRAAVKQVSMSFELRRLHEVGGGTISGEGIKKLQVLEKERDGYLAALLSPEEKFEFDVRNSSFAETTREDIRAFEPTEREFREIMAIRKQFLETYGPESNKSNEERSAALATFHQNLEQLLGQERFSEYVTAQEPPYQKLYDVASEYGIPRQRVNEVYDVIESQIAASRQRAANGQTSVAADRVASSIQEIEQTVSASLGAEAGKRFVRSVSWDHLLR